MGVRGDVTIPFMIFGVSTNKTRASEEFFISPRQKPAVDEVMGCFGQPVVLYSIQDRKRRGREGFESGNGLRRGQKVVPIRIALESSIERNSSSSEERVCEIFDFSEARDLLRTSELYFCFTSRGRS